MYRLAASLPLVLMASLGQAATIHVPGDQPTIQAGIDAAAPGDTVEIACGTYHEAELTASSPITIRSTSGVATCVTIDLQSAGPGLSAVGVSSFTLEGLTFLDATGFGVMFRGTGAASSLSVRTCRFEGTRSGNGLSINDSSAEIVDCEFVDNSTWDLRRRGLPGGAVLGDAVGVKTFRGCIFVGNSADGGSGIFGRDIVCFDCTFTGNYGTNGVGVWGFTVSLFDCKFSENEFVPRRIFDGQGGAVRAIESLEIRRCEFIGNFSSCTRISGGPTGGAVRTLAPCEITDSVFRGNRAVKGSAIYADAQAYIANCLFVDNVAGTDDLTCNGTSTVHFVGTTGSRIVENCTFARNVGVRASAIGVGGSAPTTIRNCLVAFGKFGPPVMVTGPDGVCPTLECCDLYGNAVGDWFACIADQADAKGNISADPLFCDLGADDFRVRTDSPCAPGATSCGLIGAFPVGCPPVAINHTSWGAIKERYR